MHHLCTWWDVLAEARAQKAFDGATLEEVERFLMLDALAPLVDAGRIRFYSVDSVPGQVWLTEDNTMPNAIRVQHAFDAFIVEELVPAIRTDCE